MRSCLFAFAFALVACTPASRGVPASDATSPATCVYDGKVHQAGDSFPDRDGCNQCSCAGAGSIQCTTRACAPPPAAPPDAGAAAKIQLTTDADGQPACQVEGKVYRQGEQFPDPDSCNKCTCGVENGRAGGACTEMHCPRKP